ncbi:MAG: hypothetical protein LBJ10_09770, partial [Clostridiales bacterium]|nr:hypothetical protein [Clostridiales bacterium]
MPNIFQRIQTWAKTTAAEYRYQRALAARAEISQGFMDRQAESAQRIDSDARYPSEADKSVAKLAARERIYSDRAVGRYQAASSGVRVARSDLMAASGNDFRADDPKGKGIGAFFGRLVSGRLSESAVQRQEEASAAFKGGTGFALNPDETRALSAYREAAVPARHREAQAVAKAVGDRRPARY